MEQKSKLQLIVNHKNGDRELYLSADNMDELINKIIDFQHWNNQSHDFFKNINAEKQSGWYCFIHTTKLN